jgi:GNAT superfamily N-acetyltransferase
MITIKQAEDADIPIIENILTDTVVWLDSIGEPMWNVNQVQWECLSKDFSASNFHIAYLDGVPAGCVALIDYVDYWVDLVKGESLVINKLAVKRFAAGKGVSSALISYAKSMCTKIGVSTLRLGCPQERYKLRALYERNGFICVAERITYRKYPTAFYECDVKNYTVSALSKADTP